MLRRVCLFSFSYWVFLSAVVLRICCLSCLLGWFFSETYGPSSEDLGAGHLRMGGDNINNYFLLFAGAVLPEGHGGDHRDNGDKIWSRAIDPNRLRRFR